MNEHATSISSQKAREKFHNLTNALRREPVPMEKAQMLFKDAQALELRAYGKRTLRGVLYPMVFATKDFLMEAVKLYDLAAVDYMRCGDVVKAARSFEKSGDLLIEFSKSTPSMAKRFYALYLAGRNYANASSLHAKNDPQAEREAGDKARDCFIKLSFTAGMVDSEFAHATQFVHSVLSPVK